MRMCVKCTDQQDYESDNAYDRFYSKKRKRNIALIREIINLKKNIIMTNKGNEAVYKNKTYLE